MFGTKVGQLKINKRVVWWPIGISHPQLKHPGSAPGKEKLPTTMSITLTKTWMNLEVRGSTKMCRIWEIALFWFLRRSVKITSTFRNVNFFFLGKGKLPTTMSITLTKTWMNLDLRGSTKMCRIWEIALFWFLRRSVKITSTFPNVNFFFTIYLL